MMNKLIYAFVVLSACLTFSRCGDKVLLNTPSYQKQEYSKSDILDEKGLYFIENRRVNEFHVCGYYQDKETGEKIIYYLEELRDDSNNYFIKDVLKIEQLEEGKYVEFGSIKRERENDLVIAIEKIEDNQISSNSIEIYNLWVLDEKKEKFVKKDENKFHRINENYYLKE